jgi:hypothetical protein
VDKKIIRQAEKIARARWTELAATDRRTQHLAAIDIEALLAATSDRDSADSLPLPPLVEAYQVVEIQARRRSLLARLAAWLRSAW